MATDALVLRASPAVESQTPATLVHQPDCSRPRVDLGGVLVDQINLAGAADRVREFVRSGQSHQIVTVNLDFLTLAQRSERFRETLNEADLAVPDGMPLVWASRLKGMPLVERVAGVDLFTTCCAMAADEDWGVFLLGAAEGVADAAANELQARYPGLRVVGTYSPPNGPLSSEDNDRIMEMIRASAPEFVFVALGAPRQDLWIRENLDRLGAPVAMGVGCVFDLMAGEVTRAPGWMQRSGMEWAFRLVREPRRLWKRYLLNDLPFLAQLVLSMRHDQKTTGELAASA